MYLLGISLWLLLLFPVTSLLTGIRQQVASDSPGAITKPYKVALGNADYV
jgi:hypothetical protein